MKISADFREQLLNVIDEAFDPYASDSRIALLHALSTIQDILLDTTCTDGGYYYS